MLGLEHEKQGTANTNRRGRAGGEEHLARDV